jgi:hypothetical protein
MCAVKAKTGRVIQKGKVSTTKSGLAQGACASAARSQILSGGRFRAMLLLSRATKEARMTQRKVVTKTAASTEPGTFGKTVAVPHDLVVHRALVPVAPADDAIPQELQREIKLGPDFNPDYFDTVDALIEQTYGPVTGKFRSVTGD